MSANKSKKHGTKNGKAETKDSKKALYVILIHSNGCGYCEQLMPEWNKMEGIVNGDNTLNEKCDVVKIERADMDNEMPRYKEMIGNREIPVVGYPTIVSIKDGNLHDYNGDRTAEALVNWIKGLAHQKQLGGKKSRRKRRKHSACKSCKSGRFFSLKFW